ncbi:MAG: AAA family ATPase [Taibaiella sp.]|nr:AAA family ATPase [Taibaiella sp.]
MNENQQPHPHRIDPVQIAKIAMDEINRPAPDTPGILNIKRSYEWIEQAMQQPVPTMLFDEFWNEGEICILFADTNAGKSILAVQIADSISRGEAIQGFRLEAQAQPVIYFDFELSCKQYELRYSNGYRGHYTFHPNLYRAELNPGDTLPLGCHSFEDCIIAGIEEAVLNRNVKVLVIDNLTYLRDDNERARDAKPLMQKLMALKKEHGLSILILAHTPKRDPGSPITLNHLQGSKMLMNFCDSSFCIGTSTQDKNLRYLKQIKVRAGEYRYTADQVALCRIEKPANFLGFWYIGTGHEKEHLKEKEEGDKAELIQRAKELKGEGKTQREIAEEMGISLGAVNKYLKTE